MREKAGINASRRVSILYTSALCATCAVHNTCLVRHHFLLNLESIHPSVVDILFFFTHYIRCSSGNVVNACAFLFTSIHSSIHPSKRLPRPRKTVEKETEKKESFFFLLFFSATVVKSSKGRPKNLNHHWRSDRRRENKFPFTVYPLITHNGSVDIK